MKQERVRTKRGFKGFGIFILGWFVGFIFTILTLAGVGYWAYTSISVKKIEKWTKSNITDNSGVQDLTLKDVVNIAMAVAKGSDEYTLAKFEEDFDLKLLGDSIYGISLDKLKNAPIKNLKSALNDTIESATFNNVLSFMEVDESQLGLLNTVLDSKVTYYVDNGKLYTADDHLTEVDFDYTIEGDVVEFSNGSHTIALGKITPRLRDLPLNTAMESMSDVTEDLKIYEVLGYYYNSTEDKYYENYNSSTNTYSNELTGILGSLAGYSVGDLSDNETFNGLYVYEVLGYTREGTEGNYTYKKGTEEITGVLKHLAPSTLGNLTTTINGLTLGQALDVEFSQASGVIKTFYNTPINQLNTKIDSIKIYEAMGYYYNESDGKYYNTYNGTVYSDEVTLTGIMKAIANTEVNNLSTTIENLKATDVFDKDTTTVLKLFTETELETLTVMNMPNAVVNKINEPTTTIGTLLDAGVITASTTVAEDDPVRLLTISQLIDIAMTVS